MSIQVKVNFDDGTYDYDLPYVFQINDPIEGMKSTVINGNRGDGSLVIPGGKKSQEIRIRGRILGENYEDILDGINELKTNITTDIATLTVKHWDGSSWSNDEQFTVRRVEEITFSQSLRTAVQEYSVTFLVLSYS